MISFNFQLHLLPEKLYIFFSFTPNLDYYYYKHQKSISRWYNMNRINNTMYYSKNIYFSSVNITSFIYQKPQQKIRHSHNFQSSTKTTFLQYGKYESTLLFIPLLVYSSAVSWFFFITPYSHHDDHDLFWVEFTQSYKKRRYNKSVSWLDFFSSLLNLICLVETGKVSGLGLTLLMRRRRTYVEGKLWKKYAWNVWYYCIATLVSPFLINICNNFQKEILLVHCVIFNCIRIRRQDISERYICFEGEDAIIMKMLWGRPNYFLVRAEQQGDVFFSLSIFDAMIPKIRYVDVSQ